MIKAVSTSMLVLILCMYVIKITDVSRVMLGLFYLLDITLLALMKTGLYLILNNFRQRGYNYRNINPSRRHICKQIKVGHERMHNIRPVVTEKPDKFPSKPEIPTS